MHTNKNKGNSMTGEWRPGRLLLAAFAVSLLSGCEYIDDAPLLGRYIAKNVCHDVLVSGYTPAAAIGYVRNIAPPLRNSWNVTLDELTGAVSVRNRWLVNAGTQRAEVAGEDAVHSCRNLYSGVTPDVPANLAVPAVSYAFADAVGQYPELQAFVQAQVDAGAPTNTTALLVIYDDQVVAEAYRDGVGPDSPLKGFSMSKSVANLLVGRLADQGLLDVQQPLPLSAWQNDARNQIRWDNVLRMSSGLQWHEAAIGTNNQQGILFYGSADPSAYAAQSAVATAPDAAFNYSSGDFMNIATALVDNYVNWFDPGWDLGGPFALEFSPDNRYPLLPEGVSLTTRGWAQLATIYMQQGRLGDQQILSPEWVDYSLTPSSTNFDYGAGIWLNRGQNLYPNLPVDAFAFLGSYDRFVAAIPSRKAIFVRIGYSDQPLDFAMEAFMLQALALLPAVQ
jgi:hypothetical protein